MKATAIIVAAGKGKRFRSKEKKPFAKLGRRPLVAYALSAFEKSPEVSDIILVVDKPLIKKAANLVKKYRFNKAKYIVEGGERRQDSVKNGLRCLSKNSSVVLIHDGARPFVKDALIKAVIAAAKKFGAAIPTVLVKPTIKISKDARFVSHTPERKHLREAQTPQAFKREIIERAYKKARPGKNYTDDAALVEASGKKVRLAEGDYRNIKITTVEDLRIAEALLKV